MSTSNAQMYGRRARDSKTVEELGNNVKRAIDELVRAIDDIETKVRNLEHAVR